VLDAFGRFINKNGYKAHLVFLGDGRLFEDSVKYAGSLGVSPYVSFCGHIGDTGPFYQTARCVISASRFEGLPFNVLEAFYCNKPVIASNVKGHKDLITNGLNGYLYEYGDGAKLAELMERVLGAEMDAYLDEKYRIDSVKNAYARAWKP
jgi:glycosyltransferase EpsD